MKLQYLAKIIPAFGQSIIFIFGLVLSSYLLQLEKYRIRLHHVTTDLQHFVSLLLTSLKMQLLLGWFEFHLHAILNCIF